MPALPRQQRAALRHNDVDTPRDKLRCQLGKTVHPSLGKPRFIEDGLALNVSQITEPVAERAGWPTVDAAPRCREMTDAIDLMGRLCLGNVR